MESGPESRQALRHNRLRESPARQITHLSLSIDPICGMFVISELMVGLVGLG